MKNEKIIVTRHGVDDYSVYFTAADCSVRGTYKEIMQEIIEYARYEILRSR